MQIINPNSPEAQTLFEQIVNNTLPLSYSSLKRLLISPYSFFEYKLTPPTETNPLMLGKLFDEVILANEYTDARIMIAPLDAEGNELNGNTKEFKALKKECADKNMLLVRTADYQDAQIIYQRLRMSVGRVRMISALFDPTTKRKFSFQSEVKFNIAGKEFTIPLRGEVDAYAPEYDMIIDLKSSSRAKFYGYAREFEQLRYDLQGAVYAYAMFGADIASRGAYEFAHVLIDTNDGTYKNIEIPPQRKRHGYALLKEAVAAYRQIQTNLQFLGKEAFESYCEFQPDYTVEVLF